MLPSFQDNPLKSLMIGLVKTFSKGMMYHHRHKTYFVFLNLHCFVKTIKKELPSINILGLFENVFLQK